MIICEIREICVKFHPAWQTIICEIREICVTLEIHTALCEERADDGGEHCDDELDDSLPCFFIHNVLIVFFKRSY